MIELHGSTWTDKEETHEVFDALSASFGVDIIPPSCRNVYKEKECGRTTSYMVEEGTRFEDKKTNTVRTNFKRPGVNMLLALMHFTVYPKDGLLYIPVPECARCGAAKSGAESGRNNDKLSEEIAKIRDMPMTAEEQSEYRNVFTAAFHAARSKADTQAQSAEASKSRYQMRPR